MVININSRERSGDKILYMEAGGFLPAALRPAALAAAIALFKRRAGAVHGIRHIKTVFFQVKTVS